MSRPQIRPFAEEHLADAGRLLAARHRRHRQSAPLLAARFEDPSVAEAEVKALWQAEGASGAVALREGRMVAYLLGAPRTAPVWGPNMWVESAGSATAGGPQDAEDLRDAYGAAAARWVDDGAVHHYVVVPHSDELLVRAWFRLGFGHQHTHAVREVQTTPAWVPDGLTVRPAVREDIPALAAVQVELPRHQGKSPCFSAGELETVESAEAEWREDFDDPDYSTFVAVRGGRVVGSAIGCALTKSGSNSGLIRPDDAGFLGFAAVLPDARGLGAGRALGEAVQVWAGEAGYRCVATDFRQTNLLSSRAWPALGYRDTFWRLHRTIGR